MCCLCIATYGAGSRGNESSKPEREVGLLSGHPPGVHGDFAARPLASNELWESSSTQKQQGYQGDAAKQPPGMEQMTLSITLTTPSYFFFFFKHILIRESKGSFKDFCPLKKT